MFISECSYKKCKSRDLLKIQVKSSLTDYKFSSFTRRNIKNTCHFVCIQMDDGCRSNTEDEWLTILCEINTPYFHNVIHSCVYVCYTRTLALAKIMLMMWKSCTAGMLNAIREIMEVERRNTKIQARLESEFHALHGRIPLKMEK